MVNLLSMDSIRTRSLKNAKRRKPKKRKKRPNRGRESRVVSHFEHLGETEVPTPLGYIDLLTKDFLVEFKYYSDAKAALGQVLCYSHFKPRKRKLIVLFGKGLATWKAYEPFVRVCALYDVEVFKLSNNMLYSQLKKLLTIKYKG